jgi:hypothetical protein
MPITLGFIEIVKLNYNIRINEKGRLLETHPESRFFALLRRMGLVAKGTFYSKELT